MYSKIGQPKWILVGQMLKLVEKWPTVISSAGSIDIVLDMLYMCYRVLSIEEKLKDTSISYENNLLAEEKKHRDSVVKYCVSVSSCTVLYEYFYETNEMKCYKTPTY